MVVTLPNVAPELIRPRNKFNGFYPIPLEAIPAVNAPPAYMNLESVNCHLVQLENGLIALDAMCPFQPELTTWQHDHFLCPQCGSRFGLDGEYLSGAAERGLDRYVLEVKTPDGFIRTSDSGAPVSLENAVAVLLDSVYKVPGAPRPE